ncbi:MAG: RdgB/HAM1 family non-canonical purine NTP pyrophosphatase [Candidatus Gastranaerophilales bacterium]|nr:RdgB/HAM1 family non-canonical purine NTP pyrophosphatase [Candidatus Gastranaerophilales bacterium]
MRIILGTGNPHKVMEMNEISAASGVEFISAPYGFNPEENGSTFEENSLIKSRAAAKMTGMPALADDSGLCIEALNGAPGLYSARYAGSQQKKINKILDELKNVQNRRAKFVCCMSLVDKDGNIINITKGECHGVIIDEQKGTNGFGYDPIFLPDGFNITLAEMDKNSKNAISHRGMALMGMLKFINDYKF